MFDIGLIKIDIASKNKKGSLNLSQYSLLFDEAFRKADQLFD